MENKDNYKEEYDKKYSHYGFSDNHENDANHEYDRNYSYAHISDNEEQQWKGTKTSPWLSALRSFPYPVLVLIVYLLIGFLANKWHPGWVIFLTIIPYYSIIECYASKGKVNFPFFSIVVIAYLLMGFIWNLWHPGWVIFFTIPLYWWLTSVIKSRFTKLISYPVLCIVIYLVIGFTKGIWHPSWVIFLTIPLYESISASVRNAIRQKKASSHPEYEISDAEDKNDSEK